MSISALHRSEGWTTRLAFTLALLLVLSGCSDRFGPRWVDRVTVQPDSAHVEVGETATFTPVVRDQNGEEFPGEWPGYVHWNAVGPVSVGTDETGQLVVTGINEGRGGAVGTLGRATTGVPVYVRPPGLTRIEITDNAGNDLVNSGLLMSSFGGVDANLHLYDTAGALMAPNRFRVSWQVSDTILARVRFPIGFDSHAAVGGLATTNGTVRLEGTLDLTAVVNGLKRTVPVRVTAEPVGPTAGPVVQALSATSIQVAWNRNAGGREGYRITRGPEASGSYTEVRRTPGGTFASFDTTWVDSGVEPGRTYFYRVQACNKWGCSLEPSAASAAVTTSGAMPLRLPPQGRGGGQ